MQREDAMKGLMRFRSLSEVTCFASLLVMVSFLLADAGVKDAAAKVYMNFGTCAAGSPSSIARAKTDYNMFVCENAMKWDATEGSQGNFNYSGGDQVANWCTTNGALMRGHTMIWHAQTPTWVQSLSREDMLAALKNHIINLMTHFKGKVLEWDIANECVSDGGSSSLRNSFWKKQIGDDFLDSAFTYAYRADSNVYLYYNDYSGEFAGSSKSDFIYNMVKGMKERGIPIHGVGLQCHLTAPVAKEKVSANIKRLGDLGLRVSCTETDIVNGTSNPASWGNLVQACVENYNATSFVCWGYNDAHSWKGSSCQCQLWDTQDQPKTACITAVQDAFTNGDAAVAAKRQEFLKLTPSDIYHGKGVSVELDKALRQKAGPRFAIKNNILSYHVSVTQNVHVQIIDMQGKVAVVLNLGVQNSGTHTVRLALERLPAGLYFTKIRTGDQSACIPFTRLN